MVPSVPQITADEQNYMKEAELRLQRARAAEQYATCDDWDMAATNYFYAAQAFTSAGQFDMIGAPLRRYIELQRIVDEANEKHQCNRLLTLSKTAAAPTKDCKPVLEWAKRVTAAGGDIIPFAGMFKDAGCPIPGHLKDCLRVALDDSISADEAQKQREQFGCPLDLSTPQWWHQQ